MDLEVQHAVISSQAPRTRSSLPGLVCRRRRAAQEVALTPGVRGDEAAAGGRGTWPAGRRRTSVPPAHVLPRLAASDSPIRSTAAPSRRGAPTSHRVHQPLALRPARLSGAGPVPLGHAAPWDPGAAARKRTGPPTTAQPADTHPTPSACPVLSRVSVSPTRREGPRGAWPGPAAGPPCRPDRSPLKAARPPGDATDPSEAPGGTTTGMAILTRPLPVSHFLTSARRCTRHRHSSRSEPCILELCSTCACPGFRM